MNKLLKKILILCLSVVSVACFSACDSCGGGEEQAKVEIIYTLVDGGYSVSLAKGSPTVDFTVEIPDTYNGEPVIEIAEKGFANRMFLTEVKMPDTIKKIGKEAFANTGITTLTMPTTVEGIGAYAFGGCKYLEEVVLSGDFNDWFNIAFDKGIFGEEIAENYGYGLYSSNPTHLGAKLKIKSGETITPVNQIVIPSNVEKIGMAQFTGVIVDEFIFSDGLKEIGEGAFLNAGGLTSLTLPDTLEKIGESAFSGCSLTQINLGSSLATIEKEAFYGGKLTSITIPDSVTRIGQKAFQECRSLTSVELGAGVEKLYAYAFADTGLTEITIPETLKEIDDYAFVGSTALKTVNFEEGLQKIGNSAFAECTALEKIVLPTSLVELDMGVFYGCTALKSLDFGNGIAEIPNQTAYGCSSLKSVRINKKIRYINEAVFTYCSELKNIYYTGTKIEWDDMWIGIGNELLESVTVHYMAN